MNGPSPPGLASAVGVFTRHHGPSALSAWATVALILTTEMFSGPWKPATLLTFVFFGIQAAVFLLELNWVWNPGSSDVNWYGAMMGLAKLSVLALVFYGLVAHLLFPLGLTYCSILLIICLGAREMGYEMLYYDTEGDWKTRAKTTCIGAFAVGLGIGVLVMYGYSMTAWALLRDRPLADQVLFALLVPVARLFTLLGFERYLAKVLLANRVMDALTLFCDISFLVHVMIDVPFVVSLIVFSGPTGLALALVVTTATEVAYAHLIRYTQQNSTTKQGVTVTVAAHRQNSVFGSVFAGCYSDGEKNPLLQQLPAPNGREVSAASVTASTSDKAIIKVYSPRIQSILDEYGELYRQFKNDESLVWSLQEVKAAVSVQVLASWCAIGATVLLVTLPLFAASGFGVKDVILRIVALIVCRLLADLAIFHELHRFTENGFPWANANADTILVNVFRAVATCVPASAVLAALN